MFSIIIPTFNNLEYLKLCVESLKKNSFYDHQIIVHVNIGNDGTLDYLNKTNLIYTHTNYNAGICEGVNKAAKKAKFDYILYSHDDFYFCPNWDTELKKEIDKIGHNNFYLSSSMVQVTDKEKLDCGNNVHDFDEKKLLNDYKKLRLNDFQGSTWAPHLIHKTLWNKVGGFSEEFYPGHSSDPDLNMKLWKENIRIFKGLGKSIVLHFGSITLRKRNFNKQKNELGSRGSKIFHLKWGISVKFFRKYFLQSDTPYISELQEPKKNLKFLIDYSLCKINYFYLRYIYNFNK